MLAITFLYFWAIVTLRRAATMVLMSQFFLSFNIANRVGASPFEIRVGICMLIGIFRSVEAIHVELPDKRGHIIVFKIMREDSISKLAHFLDLKTIPILPPWNNFLQRCILNYWVITLSISINFFKNVGSFGISSVFLFVLLFLL